jgi:hypothetical protein
VDRDLYRACDAASDVRQIADMAGGGHVPVSLAGDRLDSLVEKRLVLRDGGRYLSLAVPLGPYAPAAPVAGLFYETARALGRRTPEGFVIPLEGPRPHPRRRRSSARARRPTRGGTLVASQFGLTADGDLLVSLPPSKGAA